MKKIFLPLILLLLLLTGCSNQPFKDNGIINREKIVIGFDEGFAPMGFRNDKGEIVGFDVDLAKETARRMSIDIEFKPIDWSRKKEEITSGNIDMIWNGCDITDERKEYMIFSKPYMDSRQVLLVKKGNSKSIYSEYDLSGKVVGMQAGTSSEIYIDADIKNSLAELKICNSLQEGFDALLKEEYDVLVLDEIAGRYEITKNPDMFEVVEVSVSPITEFGIGFRKDNKALRDRVQEVFDSIVDDGTAKQISEKWFQADLIKLKRGLHPLEHKGGV